MTSTQTEAQTETQIETRIETQIESQSESQSEPQTEDMSINPDDPALVPTHLRRLVLTGFMGAGKSTIGRLLAARINWTFLDLDTHLESRAGATIPQLFERHGEAHFRRLESAALASALGHNHTVLALGGGTPEELTNRLLLEQTPATYTIFLDAPFPTLYDRCMLQGLNDPTVVRPVLQDPEAAQQRFAKRHPLYRRLANLTISTADQSADQTIDALLLAFAHNKT